MKRVSKQGKLQKKKTTTNKKIVQTTEVSSNSKSQNSVWKFIEKHSFAVMLLCISAILFFVYGDFITLEKVFLYKDIASDTINVFFPQMYSGYANKAMGLSYTFTFGMGQGIGAGSAFVFIDKLLGFLHNPLTFFSWFTDADNVHFMFVFRQLANILYSGILFFFYLRTVGIDKFASIVGSIIISFSGFMIVGSMWVHHTGQLVNVAIILLTFELFFMRKIWFPFIIAIALIGSIGFFYFNAVFLLVYVLFRYFDQNDFKLKDFARFIAVMGGMTLAGLLVRLPSMYNEVISMLNKPRVSGDVSKISQMQEISVWATGGFLHNVTALLRFFGNDLLGTGKITEQFVQGKRYLIPDFKGYSNYYESPMFYIGLISLILVPQAIASVSKKRKILYSSFILFWIFPVIFPYFRRAYFLFFGDYYRSFSLFLPFAILFVALRALSEIKKVNIIVLLSSIATLLFILFFTWFDQESLQKFGLFENPVKTNIRNVTVVFILVYGGILAAINYLPYYKSQLLIVLLLVVCSELMYMSNITINDRDIVSTKEFNSKESYNDYTIEAVEYIKSIDKSFYRTEKDYSSGNAVHGSLNDSYIQRYFGTAQYASFQAKPYSDFIQAFGIAQRGNEASVRWSQGLKNKPLLQITANVKYHFSKSKEPGFLKFGYLPLKTFNDVMVLKNSIYLPFGFTYDKYINRSEFDTLSQVAKEAILLQAVILDDSVAQQTKLQHHIINNNTYANLLIDSIVNWKTRLAKDTLAIDNWKQDKFEGIISLEKPKMLYFSILQDNNWKIQVNGEQQKLQTCNIGFSGIMLEAGTHSIKLFYENKPTGITQYQSLIIFLFSLIIVGIWLFTSYYKTKTEI